MNSFSIDKKTLFCAIFLFFLLILASFYFAFFHTHKTANLIDCSAYPLINKTIDCAVIDAEYSRTKDLDSEIQKIIAEEKKAGTITRASVFYRDLNTRQWFGINESADFYAASLLKLPLSIIYFKLSEIDDSILNRKITLDRVDRNTGEFFRAPDTLVTGTEYTINELIQIMLEYSDNNPVPALNSSVDPVLRSEILHDLGIESIAPDSLESRREISVRVYANILRQLYNASYLDIEHSQMLLEYLTQTKFTAGIIAGVPEGTIVAHKFGEATMPNLLGDGEIKALHDCGIVYRPDTPYIICIMTEGKNFENSAKVIQRITEASYTL